ncbi:MAG: 50S ribosomal protein L18 [Candidatus Paceibacterota bacterium]
MQKTQEKRIRRHVRIRAKVQGTAECPRLCVFRSNKHIYAQLINDQTGKIIASSSDLKDAKGKKMERASEIGKAIAELAKKQKIEKVVFDRGGNRYHGRVKALAESARQAGLKF